MMHDRSLQLRALGERALVVRTIADKADPFTKKRLLALADRYDAQLGGADIGTSSFDINDAGLRQRPPEMRLTASQAALRGQRC
jgi:hypothetical protein